MSDTRQSGRECPVMKKTLPKIQNSTLFLIYPYTSFREAGKGKEVGRTFYPKVWCGPITAPPIQVADQGTVGLRGREQAEEGKRRAKPDRLNGKQNKTKKY